MNAVFEGCGGKQIVSRGIGEGMFISLVPIWLEDLGGYCKFLSRL